MVFIIGFYFMEEMTKKSYSSINKNINRYINQGIYFYFLDSIGLHIEGAFQKWKELCRAN